MHAQTLATKVAARLTKPTRRAELHALVSADFKALGVRPPSEAMVRKLLRRLRAQGLVRCDRGLWCHEPSKGRGLPPTGRWHLTRNQLKAERRRRRG